MYSASFPRVSVTEAGPDELVPGTIIRVGESEATWRENGPPVKPASSTVARLEP